MNNSFLPFGPFILPIILITSSLEQQEEDNTSFLAEHYDLSNMLATFQKKIAKNMTVDDIEQKFEKVDAALPNDRQKVDAILAENCDLDEKAGKLTRLYQEVHYKSEGLVLMRIAQILFAKPEWFTAYPQEAQKLFPGKEFDPKFYDNRRNLLCVYTKRKI